MEPRPRILLVDDEVAITDNLVPFLERAGFNPAVAADGEAALRRVAELGPDLIVLDVMMPKLDGREVCRRLRTAGNWVPIIILAQVGASGERAMSIDEGADDYLNKPFDPQELVARIRAVLRRARPGLPPLTTAHRLACAPFVFDRPSRRLLKDERELPLTPKALALLDYLLTHPGELLSRERLMNSVWGWDYVAAPRAVDIRIAELRRCLGDDAAEPRYIRTVPGEGYVFLGKPEPVP